MAEKNQQQFHPLQTASGQARSDVESPMVQSKELRRKRRIKCLVYITAFAVFQTIIILVFALTVMRIKNPKFRVRSLAIDQNPTTGNVTRFNAEVTVKNTNFGHFKFENSTITFSHLGAPIGKTTILKGRARARSTKKTNITVDLTLPSNPTGNLTLTSHSKLSGKVHLMKVIKKKKSTEMNCTMNFDSTTKTVNDIKCS